LNINLKCIFWLQGDVVPENVVERTCAIVGMLVGAFTFAFVISQVGNLMLDLSASSAFHRNRMDQLIDFATYRRLPDDLVYDIRRYFQHRRNWQHAENDKELLGAMSNDLRSKVMKHSYQGSLQKSFLLGDVPIDQRDHLFEGMTNMFSRPGEMLYAEGDASECMFSIRTGLVEVYSPRQGAMILGPGDVFGEHELLFGRLRGGTATCLKYCDLAIAPRAAVMATLARDKKLLSKLQRKEATILWELAFNRAENEVRLNGMARKVLLCARKHASHRRRIEATRLASLRQDGGILEASSASQADDEMPHAPHPVTPMPFQPNSSDSESYSLDSNQEANHSTGGDCDGDLSDPQDDPGVASADAAAAEYMSRSALEREFVLRGRKLKRLEMRTHSILKSISALQEDCV
jgi:CRP-like cAMP-binding protein